MKCSSRWCRRVRALRRAAILGGLTLLVAACAEAAFTGLDPYYGVLVLPDTLHLRVGSSAALHAGVWLPEGTPRTLAWSTSDKTVVNLEFPTDSSVLVVARAVGKASVLATVVADPASKSAAEVQVSP